MVAGVGREAIQTPAGGPLIDSSTNREPVDAFLRQVVARERVWALRSAEGFASCPSRADAAREAILFWSDAGAAQAVTSAEWPACEAVEIDLFDFLFAWLPGMADDGVLVGIDWTAELAGAAREPATLLDEVLAALPEAVAGRYAERYDAEIGEREPDDDGG